MSATMPDTPETQSAPDVRGDLRLLLILSALMAFTSLSIDIYLPALPVLERELHGNAELTLTGFLVGFGIAQLVWGPVSDRIGRRRPLVIGVVLVLIGSGRPAAVADPQRPDGVHVLVHRHLPACLAGAGARAAWQCRADPDRFFGRFRHRATGLGAGERPHRPAPPHRDRGGAVPDRLGV